MLANLGSQRVDEYAILTNEIYKEYSRMKASEYKEFKGIRKEPLIDNMTNVEVLLTDLGETATRELVNEYKILYNKVKKFKTLVSYSCNTKFK